MPLKDDAIVSAPTDSSGLLANDFIRPHMSPEVYPSRDLPSVPCTILLGESGAGKSVELARLHEEADSDSRYSHLIDLGLAADKAVIDAHFARVQNELNERPEIHAEVKLDSWDECVIQVVALSRIVRENLMKLPLARIRLHIAARTANWTHAVSDEVLQPFRMAGLGTALFSLCPLRRSDVEGYATSQGIDPSKFLASLEARDATPLAAYPVTLRLLTDMFRRNGDLPSSKHDVYLDGIKALCSESNTTIQVAKPGDPERRFQVAKAVAAMALLSGRPILQSNNIGNGPRLAIGYADVSSLDNEVKFQEYADVFRSGLFRGVGPETYVFTHRSYAEFLAAKLISESTLSLRQLDQLLNHKDARDRIAPQLEGLASWLAAMRSDFASKKIETCPLTIISGDASLLREHERAMLVQRLLSGAHEFAPLELEKGRLAGLAHKTISEQLRPAILPGHNDFPKRVLAIAIAEACSVSTLVPEILQAARDTKLSSRERSDALKAYLALTDGGDREILLSFARGEAGDSSDDEARAVALDSLWPRRLSALEFFSILWRPKNPHHVGRYQLFLAVSVVDAIDEVDLPKALLWSRCVLARRQHGDALVDVAVAIFSRAYLAVSNTNVRVSLAQLISGDIDHVWQVTSSNDSHMRLRPEDRRLLLGEIIRVAHENGLASANLPQRLHEFFSIDDFDWLLNEIPKCDPALRPTFCRFVAWLFPRASQEQADAAMELSELVADLKICLRPLRQMDIQSDLAEEARRSYQQMLKYERRRDAAARRRRVIKVPDALVISEVDPIRGWFEIMSALVGDEHRPSALIHPEKMYGSVWNALDEDMRRKVGGVALRYLQALPNLNISSVDTSLWPSDRARASAVALLHLEKVSGGSLSSLDPGLLSKTFLWFVDGLPSERLGVLGRWVKQVAAIDPTLVLEGFVFLVHVRNAQGLGVPTKAFDSVPFELLENEVMGLIGPTGPLGARTWVELVEWLSKRGSERAIARLREEALSWRPAGGLDGASSSALACLAASTWLLVSPSEAWDALKVTLGSDREWAKAVFGRAFGRFNEGRETIALIDETRLSEMFRMIVAMYPYAANPKREYGAHYIDVDESLRDFRDRIISGLHVRGTQAGLRELEDLARDFPTLKFLERLIRSAAHALLEASWEGASPKSVAALFEDRRRWLVETEVDLMGLLLECIGEYEVRLHDELPAVFDLWNQEEKGKWRPKSENEVSNNLARFLRDRLEDRGVVVAREVEIRMGSGGKGAGERTDIHVDAVQRMPGGQHNVLRAIIEVKGCWHSDVETALESQLVGRYLADNRCRVGVYLIAWFACPQWNESDLRRQKCEKRNRAATEDALRKKLPSLEAREHLLLRVVGVDTGIRSMDT